jgi:hypothetical protein
VEARFSRPIETSLEAHPASRTMDTGLFPRGKAARALTTYSFLALGTNIENYTSTCLICDRTVLLYFYT